MEIPDEAAKQLIEDTEKVIKAVTDNLPNILLQSACDIEKRIIETEFNRIDMTMAKQRYRKRTSTETKKMETNIKELEKMMAESVAKEVLRIQESDNPYMNFDFCKQANDGQPCKNLMYWNDDTEHPTCQLNLISIFLVRKKNCNPNKSSRFRIL